MLFKLNGEIYLWGYCSMIQTVALRGASRLHPSWTAGLFSLRVEVGGHIDPASLSDGGRCSHHVVVLLHCIHSPVRGHGSGGVGRVGGEKQRRDEGTCRLAAELAACTAGKYLGILLWFLQWEEENFEYCTLSGLIFYICVHWINVWGQCATHDSRILCLLNK